MDHLYLYGAMQVLHRDLYYCDRAEKDCETDNMAFRAANDFIRYLQTPPEQSFPE
jgi:hypothetical protein